MYLQKVLRRKICLKISFCWRLKVNDENSRIGSISQRHGSEDPDPDPHQNVLYPEHCPPPPVVWQRERSLDALLIKLSNECALTGNLNKMRYCCVDSFCHWEGAKSKEVSFFLVNSRVLIHFSLVLTRTPSPY
jgi:hypothetical protein